MIAGITIPDGSIPGTIPLTTRERELKAELEAIVESGLERFLKVGSALAELRNKRLYRTDYATFEEYIQARFGLHRSAIDDVIRSAQTAQALINNGIQLSPNASVAVIRPVSALPSDKLQVAGYKLIESVSPQCGPTEPIASKVCRIIRNAIEPCNGNGRRDRKHPSRERPFVQAAQRLSQYDGFDAALVVSHVDKLPNASTIYTACNRLIDRCVAVKEVLVNRFPELEEKLV